MEICPLAVGGGDTSQMPLTVANSLKTPTKDQILVPADLGCQEYTLVSRW